jgi:hypothetical protein
VLARGRPWRVFRWHRGQAHYSGWYWSATMGRHVVYESRLELHLAVEVRQQQPCQRLLHHASHVLEAHLNIREIHGP